MKQLSVVKDRPPAGPGMQIPSFGRAVVVQVRSYDEKANPQ